MKRLFPILISALFLSVPNINAQLSTNPDKFLGNITTYGNVDYGNEAFYTLWNQITCENETKWASVEGTRGSFNWGSADKAYNYAKEHKFPFKFHTLVWGSQYPNWFSSSLSVQERYNAIVKWMNAVQAHYPNLEMIDVVNEAIGTHQAGNPLMKETLGGGGTTGYDWLIKAFELAYERWPNAILIYNDYNTFQWDTDNFIDLVSTLRDAGAPIDAYGCQSHDVTGLSLSALQASEQKIQNALKMPMYITEYDIGTKNDQSQLNDYKNQIPYLWEKDYCAGITLWGYIYGATWIHEKDSQNNIITRGISGIIKDGSDRPAMEWLRGYMKTDAAKNAKSPFPGMKKQISLYIKPATLRATRGDTLAITVRAQMVDKTKTIDSIKFYVKGVLDTIMTEAPFIAKYVPATTGKHALKAIAYTSDGKTYQREGSFTAYNPRSVFNNDTIKLPGTIQAENFDKGDDGVTYHDSNSNKEGDASSYRSDGGVDIVNGNGGKAIGYTNTDEWLEYTVNVKEAGYYNYKAVASSGTTGSGFQLALSDIDGLTNITNKINVPQTASSDWSKYTTISGRTLIPLKEGDQVIRLTITGSSCNIDKIIFEHIEVTDSINIKITSSPSTGTAGTASVINFTPVYTECDSAIAKIRLYTNGNLTTDTIKSRPFHYNYKPSSGGKVSFTAIAIDTLGRESAIAQYTYKIRGPYSSAISIPGTIQAENFDKGGEGLSFHDKDSNDEGDANYRTDNEGVDIVKGNNGNAIGYTSTGEWLEYTVNVKADGIYKYSATVSSGVSGSGFRLGLMKNGTETQLATISVPQTGNNSWDTYKAVSGSFKLSAGTQVIRLTITGSSCNIDKIAFSDITNVNYITEDDNHSNGTRYNLGGVRVNEYKGITIMEGKKVLILE